MSQTIFVLAKKNMRFGEDYTRYWAHAVTKSVDGTVIAGLNEAKVSDL